MKSISIFMLVFLLSACTTPLPEPQGVWYRSDGRSMQADPTLLKQGELDRNICEGERQKVLAANTQDYTASRRDAAFEIMKSCMAKRGYGWR